MSLFNLREDPGENINLADQYPGKLEEMLNRMDSAYRALGDLPPPLRMRSPADTWHYDYLTEKYGPEFYDYED